MAPPKVRLPLVGVSMVSLALQAMLRLMVWVTGEAGFPLKPMLPAKVMPLPFSTKAPAAASNVMLLAVMLVRSLVFASLRVAGKGQPDGEDGHRILIPVAGRAPIIIRTGTGPNTSADAARHLQITGANNKSREVAGIVSTQQADNTVGVEVGDSVCAAKVQVQQRAVGQRETHLGCCRSHPTASAAGIDGRVARVGVGPGEFQRAGAGHDQAAVAGKRARERDVIARRC
jgi:hypothetical protein